MDRRLFTTMFLTAAAGVFHSGCESTPNRSASEVDLDVDPPQPEIGTLFTYNHEGPRPFGEGDQDVSGKRAFGVYRQEGNLWRIDEAFQLSPAVRAIYVDDAYRLHREVFLSGEGELAIEYSPARPLRYLDLKKRDPETITFQQTYRQPARTDALATATVTDTTTRRYDERIVTPVGALLCRSFQTELTFELEANEVVAEFSVSMKSYWSDQYAWFISQEAIFSPVRQGGQTLRSGFETRSELLSVEQTRT